MSKVVNPFFSYSNDGARALFSSLPCLETLLGSTEPNDDNLRDDPLHERARLTVWRLRRAYEDAIGDNIATEIIEYLQELSKRGAEVSDAIVVWVKLIEELLQDAETRFGSVPGRGPEKKQHVKAVIVNLLVTSPRFDIPNIPSYLEPLVIDFAADCTIDTLVHLFNHHNLWSKEPPPSSAASSLFRWLIRLVSAPLARLKAGIAGFVRRWVIARNRLSPAAEATIEKIVQLGLKDEVHKIIDEGARVLGWIGSHRKQLFAAIDLVTIAVQEAEVFLEMSGPQKKAFARELILVFIEDTDLIRWQTGFWYFFVEWILDGAIDSVVATLNRHQVFRHRTA